MSIKAIETEYKGYRFRSRTEARWAVFFEKFGAKYWYEPRGFKLRSGEMYLPDFYVEGFADGGQGAWFEVKPDTEIDENWIRKIEFLSEHTSKRVYLLDGVPDLRSYLYYEDASLFTTDGQEDPYSWYKVNFNTIQRVNGLEWTEDTVTKLDDFTLDDLNGMDRSPLLPNLFSKKYRDAVKAAKTKKF